MHGTGAAIFLLEGVSTLHGEYVYVLAFDGREAPDIREIMHSIIGNYQLG